MSWCFRNYTIPTSKFNTLWKVGDLAGHINGQRGINTQYKCTSLQSKIESLKQYAICMLLFFLIDLTQKLALKISKQCSPSHLRWMNHKSVKFVCWMDEMYILMQIPSPTSMVWSITFETTHHRVGLHIIVSLEVSSLTLGVC